jgi:FlaA1/EpsC-like NDP-sugar epimerase
VTHPEMVRYFMTIPEAAQLVLQAGAIGHGGEIFILDMGEPVRIVDLARDIITLSGLKPNEDIQIVYSGQRPGEKLFEELELTGEQITKTRHPKIFIGRIEAYPGDAVRRALERLEGLVRSCDQEELYRYLNDLLPGAQLAALGQSRGDAAANYAPVTSYAGVGSGGPVSAPQLPRPVRA